MEKEKATGTTEEKKQAEAAAPSEAEKKEQRARLHKKHVRAFRDMIFRLLFLALAVYVLFFHLVGLTVMRSGDMYPRIDHGDLVLFYRLEKNIHAQDIVVFRKPTAALELSYEERTEMETAAAATEKSTLRKALDWLGFVDPADPPKTEFICRVVAGPGDKVEISEGERLIVNGNAMIENGIFYNTPEYAGFVEYPLILGPDEYFVLADYRSGGADSRFFGAVKKDEILGTVITIVRRNNL